MKKILLPWILFSLFIQGNSQQITGTVYDKLTQSMIRDATVFFNGSTVFTTTDKSGNFQLIPPEKGKLPIIATGRAYESLFLLEYKQNAHIHFYLDSKMFAFSNEILPKNERSERQSRPLKVQIFREQFLGKSTYGSSCRILNEGDLILTFEPHKNLLKATCSNPLIIINKSLGYRIIYYLKKFEFNLNSEEVLCSGFLQFSDEPSLKAAEFEIAGRKRELAYFGSWMEFFRSLWSNSLDSAGYDLRSSSNKELTYDSLVIEKNGSKYWKYKGPVTIYHFSRNKSTTIQTSDTVYFDRLGYCDTDGIDWRRSGEMTLHRLGDQLPFDYKVNHTKNSMH